VEAVATFVNYISNFVYIALTLICFRRWRLRGGEAGLWAALTFGVLAVVGLTQLVAENLEPSAVTTWLDKTIVAGVVFFPYFLLRFTSALRPLPRWVLSSGLGASFAIAVGFLIQPEIPGPGADLSVGFQILVYSFLAQWTGLSTVVATTLWRAGRGEPTVVRRRMKLLSIATVTMILLLIIAGTIEGGAELDVTVYVLALGAGVTFFLGLAPPASLRILWRKQEEQTLQEAIQALVAASSVDEVTAALLPSVTEIVGGRAAELMDDSGESIAEYKLSDAATEGSEPVRISAPFGSIIVWTSPFTPFFGREELEMVRTLGNLAGLALERSELSDRADAARRALEEAQSIAHVGSWEWDIANDVVTWSDQLFRNYGYEPGAFEVSFERFLEQVHPEDREETRSIVERAYETHEPFEYDHRTLWPDGEVRTLYARGRVITDDSGNPVRMVGIGHDVTEQRGAQAELEASLERERRARAEGEKANQELEHFIHTVSHDLNSPLITVLGFTEFLKRDHAQALPETAQSMLDRIESTSKYMQALIQDLLELSRVGRLQTESEPVDLDALVSEIGDEIRHRYPNVVLEKGELPAVSMNPVRARQLFDNLLVNAVVHAQRNDVVLNVTASDVSGKGVLFSIRDNGPGIPAEHRTKVFGVFERLGGGEAMDVRGTGMGLAICKRIVESVGGTIWIEESPEGTDFRIDLPARMLVPRLDRKLRSKR
jgi:PAS domain S-box-containing protein